MKSFKKLCIILLPITVLFIGASAYADEETDNLPHVTLSELYASDLQEAVVTDLPATSDVSTDTSSLFGIYVNLPFGNGGRWVYKYTVDPYSFYQNSATGEWRTLQTTSTVNHTVNTVVNGVVTHSSSWPVPYYNPAYAHLMGG